MISKQYIKDLEFKTIEDIFNYIIESKINGAISQCKELINKLSNGQFKEFIVWFDSDLYTNEPLNYYIGLRFGE